MYFKVFSIIMGLVSIGARFLIHFIPEEWNKFELDSVYTEKKPRWVWGVGLASLLIVALTWYKEVTTEVNYSIILTVIVTLTLIKTSQILFNYHNFRNFVKKILTEDRGMLLKINIGAALMGILLIILGIFVY